MGVHLLFVYRSTFSDRNVTHNLDVFPHPFYTVSYPKVCVFFTGPLWLRTPNKYWRCKFTPWVGQRPFSPSTLKSFPLQVSFGERLPIEFMDRIGEVISRRWCCCCSGTLEEDRSPQLPGVLDFLSIPLKIRRTFTMDLIPDRGGPMRPEEE